MPSLPSPERAELPRRVRWWIASAILAVAAVALLWLWLLRDDMLQRKVEVTGGIGALALLALLGWALGLARFRWRTRGWILCASTALVLAALALFEVRGVTGDMVPLLALRFAPRAPAPGAAALEGARPAAARWLSYPQFLGPGRDGVVRGVALARDWSATPPRLVWRREVGAGWSGFAVRERDALTQEQRGREEAVACYDLKSGELRWIHTWPASFESDLAGNGPRATPTCTESRVLALGATGTLVCLERASGTLVWSLDVLADNDAASPRWGVSGSPLVLDGRVIVCAGGGAGRSLVAYDLATGARVWSAGSDRAGYSSPQRLVLAGVPQIVAFNGTSLAGHDPDSGALLWQTPWSGNNPNVAQPVPFGGDRIVVSSGYGVGCALYRIRRDGAGALAAERAWKSLALKAKFANFVAREGYAYGLDDGTLACVDLASGARRWKGGRFGHGQLVLVDDLLLVVAESGEVLLCAASPDGPSELGRFDALDSKTWNSPALAAPFLLVRNDREAACYELPLAAPLAPPSLASGG